MRAVGLFSRDRAALERFAERWRGAVSGVGAGSVRLRFWPATSPLMAIATTEGVNPPLQWAEAPDGSCALLDGEIFALDGSGDSSAEGCDAAALLALYSAKGTDGIAAMNGAAALIIFDAPRRSLLLFRDRFGQVPLFYASRPEGLYWASDIPSLFEIGVPGALDLRALDFFLATGYVPAPWTFVEEIRKVPPAHYLYRTEGGDGEMKRYWTPTGRPKLVLSPEETAEQLGGLIEQSVRRRYAPGSRTGVLLSGGVDSSLLAGCLASRIGADIDAFTFRYGAYEGQHNEFAMAHETAAHFGIRHHALEYGPADVAENFERMVHDYGEPFMWGIHTFKLHGVVDTGVATLLTGTGVGDWNLSPLEVSAMLVSKLPAPVLGLAATVAPALSLLNRDHARHVQTFLRWCRATIPLFAMTPVMSDAYRRRMYHDPGLVDSGRGAAAELLEGMRRDIAEESKRDQFVFLRQRLFIAECNLFWNHAWARAANLAARHPYYDNDLQEYVMRLPRLYTNKEDLRRYAATVLPQERAHAPKIYHTIPLGHWFRGPLQGFLREQISSERLTTQGLFEPRAVAQLIDEHVSGRAVHTWRLLALLSVTVWQDTVLKNAALGSP